MQYDPLYQDKKYKRSSRQRLALIGQCRTQRCYEYSVFCARKSCQKALTMEIVQNSPECPYCGFKRAIYRDKCTKCLTRKDAATARMKQGLCRRCGTDHPRPVQTCLYVRFREGLKISAHVAADTLSDVELEWLGKQLSPKSKKSELNWEIFFIVGAVRDRDNPDWLRILREARRVNVLYK